LAEKKGFLVHQGGGAEVQIDVAGFINRQRGGRATGVVRLP
jgi:hypothetical protein